MIKLAVGQGSCGLAAGAGEVYDALEQLASGAYKVCITGCIGLCFLEPLVDVYEDGVLLRRMVRVKEKHAPTIAAAVRERNFDALDRFTISEEDSAVLTGQTRIALRGCGVLDPTDIDSYLSSGGYGCIRAALSAGTPQRIIDEVKISGLAGRGGAGFPTWRKWQTVHDTQSDVKYIVCNADEGDPGAFMDRAILESNPHGVIEGMLLAAYAVGAAELRVYIRAEYPLALARIRNAVKQAKARGFLGDNCFGTGHGFHMQVCAGMGAFVCGEETALIAALEGRRGVPRSKPPYPAEAGYRGRPTCINNVATLANIPWIMEHGGAAFAAIGTEESKGTKVFALAGQVLRGGLVEVPMGTALRQIISGLGGGTRTKAPFKAVQLGGPSGGYLPEALLDTPVGYKALAETGAIMGSGGMVVMDQSTCLVEMARFFLQFISRESCGKCAPCRIGTRFAYDILSRIVEGQAQEHDIERLEQTAAVIRDGALCGLGQTALNPVLTILRYFRPELEAHVSQKHCPSGQCAALRTYYIVPKLCRNCGLCLKSCPVNCILRVPGHKFTIDQDICIKCDACIPFCPFDAIVAAQGGESHE